MGNCWCHKQTSDESNVVGDTPIKKTSEESLIEFVNSQLRDPSVNSSLIPDSLEKEMYMNVLKTVIGNLHHVADSIKIEILNHVITLHIQPK